jgi:hypothetical protein
MVGVRLAAQVDMLEAGEGLKEALMIAVTLDVVRLVAVVGDLLGIGEGQGECQRREELHDVRR